MPKVMGGKGNARAVVAANELEDRSVLGVNKGFYK